MTLKLEITQMVLIGIGATVIMDLWLLLLQRLGVPTLNFAYIGRWIGHLFYGQWSHVAIARAAPIRGELAVGWITHYAVGIAFAALLVLVTGLSWIASPTPLPAVLVGMCTVIVPLCVLQPAMGAGFASSKTPTPLKNCIRSLANHTVFGIGLYLSAETVTRFFQSI